VTGVTADTGVRVTEPNTNFDAGDSSTGVFGVDDGAFVWIRFDVSSIPASAVVESVTFFLYSVSHGNVGEFKRLEIAAARNTTAAANWDETTATWTTFDGASPWTGGGDGGVDDRDTVVSIRTFSVDDENAYYSFRFNKAGVRYVQEGIGNVVSFQIYATRYGHSRQFALSEGPDGKRPYLEITYEEATEAYGLQNYGEVLEDPATLNPEEFPWPPLGTLIHNFLWILIHLPLTLFAGLFLATILKDVKGATIVKGTIFLGMVTPMIVGGVILRFLFEGGAGIVPAFFSSLGIERLTFWGREVCVSCTWTIQRETLLFGLIFGSVWLWTGFSLIIYSAGLTTVPQEYFEAAKIDGTSPFRMFYRITFPLLRPVTLVIVTMTVLWELKIFDIVWAVTGSGGGPGRSADVLALQMYRYAFIDMNIGLAAVVATLLTLLTLFSTIWMIRYVVKK
jgi:multiple sugar transport system permease protein